MIFVPAALGMVLFLGSMISILFVRCPNCSGRLAHTIVMPVGFSFDRRQRVNYCPFCGVALDEAYPVSGNPITH